VSKLVEQRRIAPDTARALADGRVYTAEQALANRLVDQIGYMPDALALARKEAGVDEAKVVVYHRPRAYRATYYAGAETSVSAFEASVAQLAALAAAGPRFLYLWSP
jgi:protease-4